MTNQGSVDGILDFLKKNRFSKAEEALRNELNNRSDLNGFLQKLIVEEKDSSKGLEPRDSEVSKELIVKEVDFGTSTNGSVTKWENGEKPSKKVISREMSFTFSENSGDPPAAAPDARSCKFTTTSGNGTLESCRSAEDVGGSSLVDLYALEQSRRGDVADIDKKVVETGEDIVFFGNKTASWSGSTSKGNSGSKVNETDRLIENFGKHENYMGSVLLRTEDVLDTRTSDNWKECSVETLFGSSRGGASTSYNLATSLDKREGKKKTDTSDVREAIKQQESEVARALFFGKTQSTFDDKNISSLGFPLVYDARKEEFPRLPPVKLKSEDNPLSLYCEEKFERDGSGSRLINDEEEALLIGSYLDVPIGQEISSSGGKKSAGGNWLSVSQGIAEDASDLVSGFATIGDGLSESVDYRNEYWDSDDLDEIKLLKYVNKHDPADKYHLLRLYDYFYYREHLLIVCELLKANLYEFHKFNRESGGEVYFTMPRLQSITIQCLEALQFLHGLGLIHCDLKPENILVKSYSRCEIKVIDLGSSCFETDHLCSYVQSRSYRAPEVILGLPYDKKIDVWSLGCILAELCTGNVLFQNDSPASLLARVMGIIGTIDQEMLTKGRDSHKYFTKNRMLYERNQESNRLEYLIPKRTSLRHRLPMGDQGFTDFVAHLLEINPKKRPSASEALKHPWLSYPYEPISA
ncbi:hypothetical protein BRARA_G02317 [Brassica rapa]|uniref:Protein kinase domain-containing protein n=1 Tax=Brassica campestris TaxID=3711 RepID=A0A397YNN2_BRACM|nr:hypothetical protein BRARA_G02317 [Brassica rapa]